MGQIYNLHVNITPPMYASSMIQVSFNYATSMLQVCYMYASSIIHICTGMIQAWFMYASTIAATQPTTQNNLKQL